MKRPGADRRVPLLPSPTRSTRPRADASRPARNGGDGVSPASQAARGRRARSRANPERAAASTRSRRARRRARSAASPSHRCGAEARSALQTMPMAGMRRSKSTNERSRTTLAAARAAVTGRRSGPGGRAGRASDEPEAHGGGQTARPTPASKKTLTYSLLRGGSGRRGRAEGMVGARVRAQPKPRTG